MKVNNKYCPCWLNRTSLAGKIEYLAGASGEAELLCVRAYRHLQFDRIAHETLLFATGLIKLSGNEAKLRLRRVDVAA